MMMTPSPACHDQSAARAEAAELLAEKWGIVLLLE
jgi:hypothetical protein